MKKTVRYLLIVCFTVVALVACDSGADGEREPGGQRECLHSNVNITEVKATCTENGSLTKKCKDCGHVTTEELLATGHEEIGHVSQDPTCTEVGWDDYISCAKCDYTTYEEKAALGHAEVVHEAKDPTCDEIGWDAYVSCSRCDHTTYVEKASLGHDEVAHESKAPTCTEIGWDAYVTCTRCDYSTYAPLDKKAHSYENDV